MGVVLWFFPSLSTLIGLLVVLIGGYRILNASDPNGLLPIYFSAYIVGIEVLLRMTRSVLFWEFGKYAIILFLLLGFLRKRQVVYIYSPVIVYFICLLPAIFLSPMESFNLWRQSVAFNLSGPACLMVSSLYFYNTQLSFEEMKKMLLIAILPIVTMSILVVLRMRYVERFTNNIPHIQCIIGFLDIL